MAWAIAGTFGASTLSLSPGDQVPMSGRVYLFVDESVAPPPTDIGFDAELLGDAEGLQVGRRVVPYVSPYLTLTGLPIAGIEVPTIGVGGTDILVWQYDGERWVAEFEASLRVPDDARSGLYEISGEINRHGEGPSKAGQQCEAASLFPLLHVLARGVHRWRPATDAPGCHNPGRRAK